MDPFSTNVDGLPDDFVNHPSFSVFMRRISGNSNHFPQTPSTQNISQEMPPPNYSPQNYIQSPQAMYQGSNSQYEDIDDEDDTDAENVPETQPEPILTHQHTTPKNSRCGQDGPTSNIWSTREDEALISSYMEHCTDIVVSTNQKASVVWRKVKQSYDAAQRSRPMELTKDRNVRMIESRWRRLGKDVMSFVAHYEEAKRMDKSGMQVDDIKQLAHTLYCNNNKSNFRYEISWKMLSKYKKWEERVQWGMSKEDRIRLNQISEPDISDSGKRVRTDDEDLTIETGGSYMSGRTARPDGVKKAKANLRKGKGKVVADEVAMAVSESIRLHARVRENDIDYKKSKLEVERAKENRKEKQLELEQRNFEHQQEKTKLELLKSKYDMLTALYNRLELTPAEEKFKQNLMMELYGSNP